MKILYIHGFGSSFDPNHEKVKILETLGTVVGVDIDYCKGFTRSFETALEAVLGEAPDLIVGTSMGGYMASHVGTETGTPFVSLNPATEPSQSLRKWIGTFTDYSGREHCLTEGCVENYPDFQIGGYGLVLVETGDEVISASNTVERLKDEYQVEIFQGGSHRFSHMEQALPLIQEHYNMSEANNGVETE